MVLHSTTFAGNCLHQFHSVVVCNLRFASYKSFTWIGDAVPGLVVYISCHLPSINDDAVCPQYKTKIFTAFSVWHLLKEWQLSQLWIRKHVDRQTKTPIWYTNKNGEELDPSCSDECFCLNAFSSRICGCTAACSLLLITSGRCYSELLVQEDCQNLTGSGTPPSASSALTASAIS